MRLITVLGTTLALLLAGCLGGGGEPATTLSDVVQSPQPSRSLNLTVTTDDVLAPRNLSAPPQWKTGEWWHYRLTDDFTGSSVEFTRVVAGTDGDDYLVGMPADQFSHDIMVLHMPGFGQISRSNLSFEVHDVRFAPLEFPLEVGKTWNTAWEGQPLTATVATAKDNKAVINAVSNNGNINMEITYDAEIGEVTALRYPGYASYEVISHGFDFTGVMTVPHMHDLIFQQQRLGVPVGPQGGEPALVTDVVNVDPTYDRVSFVIIAGNIPPSLIGLPDPGAPVPNTYYKETATAPDGEVFEVEVLPTDAAGLHIAFFGKDMPGGDWRFDHMAAGPGLVLSEGIAYHVYDVDLPSGRILPSMGEHAHGG